MQDLTVEWEAVVPHSAVTSVPDDATPADKLRAAKTLAAGMTPTGNVVRGTVHYKAADGTFGGSIA